jgi:hypothetical protein
MYAGWLDVRLTGEPCHTPQDVPEKAQLLLNKEIQPFLVHLNPALDGRIMLLRGKPGHTPRDVGPKKAVRFLRSNTSFLGTHS